MSYYYFGTYSTVHYFCMNNITNHGLKLNTDLCEQLYLEIRYLFEY